MKAGTFAKAVAAYERIVQARVQERIAEKRAASIEIANKLLRKLERAETDRVALHLTHIEGALILNVLRFAACGFAPTTKARRKPADTSKRRGRR